MTRIQGQADGGSGAACGTRMGGVAVGALSGPLCLQYSHAMLTAKMTITAKAIRFAAASILRADAGAAFNVDARFPRSAISVERATCTSALPS
jgi:hypothetical protein